MRQTNTRKIISVILTIIISVSSVIMLSSLVLMMTFSRPSFIENHFVNDKIALACEEQLDIKYNALSAESGIPSRVFEMVKEDYNTSEAVELAVTNLFSEDNESFYSKDRVNYFENLCREYLDGNDISYSDDNVHRVAEKATKIYSNTVGVHNVSVIRDNLSAYNNACSRVMSTAFVIAVFAGALLYVLYKRKANALSFIASGLAGGGVATFIGGAMCAIAKLGKGFAIYPDVYKQSFVSMVNIYFVNVMCAGLLCMAISAVLFYFVNKEKNKKDKKSRVTLEDALRSRFKDTKSDKEKPKAKKPDNEE